VTIATSASIDRLFSEPATYFRTTAIPYRSMGSPFYEGLARLCAEDAELTALVAETPKGQPYNHTFSGAVHFLVLGDPSDPLAPYFGQGGRAPVADAATFAALKSERISRPASRAPSSQGKRPLIQIKDRENKICKLAPTTRLESSIRGVAAFNNQSDRLSQIQEYHCCPVN